MYTKEQILGRICQGDVVLFPVLSIPPEARLVEDKSKVLQQSETTGHHHHFKPGANVDVYETGPARAGVSVRHITPDMGKYIHVPSTEELFHGLGFDKQPQISGRGDHESQVIAPGLYQVVITREFNYDTMETVRVVD